MPATASMLRRTRRATLLVWQAWPTTMICKKRSSRQCALYLSQAVHEATSNWHGRVAIRDTVQREPACLVDLAAVLYRFPVQPLNRNCKITSPKPHLNIIAAVVQEDERNATEPSGIAENGHLPDAEGQKPDKQAERHICCGMRHAATD